MVTLKEIAERSGASINTVSRALNGKLSESWPKVAARAQSIRDLAREMGYRPNAAAQTMRNQKSHNIGVLMSGGYTAEYEVPVLLGVGEVLREAGYTLSLIQALDCEPEHLQQIPAFRDGFLDAIFIEHVPGYLTEYARDIFSTHVHLDSNVRLKKDCVFRDEYAAGLMAAEQTARLGHKDILYVTHIKEDGAHINVVDRLQGCLDGCKKHGCHCEVLEVGFSAQEVEEGTRRLWKLMQKYHALITSGQGQAQWSANMLSVQGLCAGRDYSLCSCAEKIDSKNIWGNLSRVNFDRIEMGRIAGKMMLKKLNAETPKSCKSIIVTGEWVEGQTTCKAGQIKR